MRPLVAIVAVAALVALAAIASAGRSGSAATTVIAPPAPRVWDWPVAALRVGDAVTQGQLIGAVGSSGYPEGGPHLHFEIRVDDDFYGDGLPLTELRYALSVAFR